MFPAREENIERKKEDKEKILIGKGLRNIFLLSWFPWREGKKKSFCLSISLGRRKEEKFNFQNFIR